MRVLIVGMLICSLIGCAGPRPVLYPNDQLQRVGEEAAQRDIDECMQLARDADLEGSEAAEAAMRTGVGGATGAAAGAVGGAIGGGGAGTGALVGLGVGGVLGFFSWLFGRRQPEPVYVNYVNLCLQERGYRTVGWK